MLADQLSQLIEDEGIRLVVYDDATGREITSGTTVVGHATIGVGRALDVNGITQSEAKFLLTNDIDSVEAQLRRLPWYSVLDPVRQGVIANLAFNMGVRGVCGFTHMTAALLVKDYGKAAAELADSKWAHEVQRSRVDRLIFQLQSGTSSATLV